MLVPIIPDQLLYSTCWPGVSYRYTQTDKMMICTLASNPEQRKKKKNEREKKKNPFCTTVTSTGNEKGRRFGGPPVQAKQSVCGAEEMTFLFAKK